MRVTSGEQQNPQEKPKRYMVSPYSGAAVEVPNKYSWKKGQSGNPAGQSLKVRLRMALDDLPPDQIKAVVANIARLAQESNDPTAVSAFQAICRAAGVFSDETNKEKVEIVTTLVFEDRRGGEPSVPQRMSAAPRAQQLPRTADGTVIDVDVK